MTDSVRTYRDSAEELARGMILVAVTMMLIWWTRILPGRQQLRRIWSNTSQQIQQAASLERERRWYRFFRRRFDD
jgi:hypothetical protein